MSSVIHLTPYLTPGPKTLAFSTHRSHHVIFGDALFSLVDSTVCERVEGAAGVWPLNSAAYAQEFVKKRAIYCRSRQ